MEQINLQQKERVLLLGVFETENARSESELMFDKSMEELDALVRACEMDPVGRNTQQLPSVNTGCYMGSGKLAEVSDRIRDLAADLIVVNDTLTPTQLRNLQKELGTPVMDRTSLILEIFKKRARSREAKLQVELANLQYIKPRLIGMWETQNRQGGASGAMSSKGEGETQLELDRREIDHRLAELRRELREVEKERETQRKKRQNSRLPMVSLVGYTNAGKSAIMNAMLRRSNRIENGGTPDESEDAALSKGAAFTVQEAAPRSVFEENMLFATLDTSVRKITSGGNQCFMLSDTVGFVNKLPTSLVEAFKSTLEEVKEADLLLHVIDYSDPGFREQVSVTEKMIEELGCGHIPVIRVYNKADACFPSVPYPKKGPESRDAAGNPVKSIYMCAKEQSSIELLAGMITDTLFDSYEEAEFLVPYDKGAAVSALLENALSPETSYTADGTLLKCRCHKADIGRYREYLTPAYRLPEPEPEPWE